MRTECRIFLLLFFFSLICHLPFWEQPSTRSENRRCRSGQKSGLSEIRKCFPIHHTFIIAGKMLMKRIFPESLLEHMAKFRHYMRTPAVQSSWTVSYGRSSKQQQVSVRDTYFHPSCSTCSKRRSCRKHSMTTTYPSPLVEGPYATYNLLTSILWVTAMVNFKTSSTDSKTEQWHMEWSQHRKEQDHDQQHEQHPCRY